MLLMDLYHPKFTRPSMGSHYYLFGEDRLSPSRAMGTSGTKDASDGTSLLVLLSPHYLPSRR